LRLRRQAGARDLLHLFAKTIQLAERGEDVMFVEQILNNIVRL